MRELIERHVDQHQLEILRIAEASERDLLKIVGRHVWGAAMIQLDLFRVVVPPCGRSSEPFCTIEPSSARPPLPSVRLHGARGGDSRIQCLAGPTEHVWRLPAAAPLTCSTETSRRAATSG